MKLFIHLLIGIAFVTKSYAMEDEKSILVKEIKNKSERPILTIFHNQDVKLCGLSNYFYAKNEHNRARISLKHPLIIATSNGAYKVSVTPSDELYLWKVTEQKANIEYFKFPRKDIQEITFVIQSYSEEVDADIKVPVGMVLSGQTPEEIIVHSSRTGILYLLNTDLGRQATLQKYTAAVKKAIAKASKSVENPNKKFNTKYLEKSYVVSARALCKITSQMQQLLTSK